MHIGSIIICISLFWLQLFKIVLVVCCNAYATCYYIRLSQLWFTMLLMFISGLQNSSVITKFSSPFYIYNTHNHKKRLFSAVFNIKKFTSILLVSCWKKNLPTTHSNIWTASIHFFQIFKQDVRTWQKAIGIHLLHMFSLLSMYWF